MKNLKPLEAIFARKQRGDQHESAHYLHNEIKDLIACWQTYKEILNSVVDFSNTFSDIVRSIFSYYGKRDNR